MAINADRGRNGMLIRPTNCQCRAPGDCPLLGRKMSAVRWDECKNKPHYFEMFLAEADEREAKKLSREEQMLSFGVGTELKALLSRIGITPSADCKCNQHAMMMNERGIGWCKTHISEIVELMSESARQQGVPFVGFAAIALVKLAIRRAIKKRKSSP